jgi:hypothetical protein
MTGAKLLQLVPSAEPTRVRRDVAGLPVLWLSGTLSN